MPTTLRQRFTALDVFRGMTICFMIIVNTPGNGDTTFAPLHHADWHGFTPTDLVFPTFVFVIGNAMSFVMPKWSTMSTGSVLAKIFKRTIIIFLLGYLLYWFPFIDKDAVGNIIIKPVSETRIFGVLQRLALVYCISSLMLYFLKERTAVVITIIILILYWPVMMYFGDPSDPLSKHGNAVLRLDTWLIGEKHLYTGEGFPFEPEGLLSNFPAIGNCIAGYIVGKFVQRHGKTYEGLAKLLLAGFGLLVIAHFWNYQFPVNKKLWTSSFVLETTGLDCMILAGVIYYIDFLHKQRGVYFFEVFGKNPIAIYLFSEIFISVLNMIRIGDTSLHGWTFQNIFVYATPYVGSALSAITYMLVCWYVGYWMDKKKIYIRV